MSNLGIIKPESLPIRAIWANSFVTKARMFDEFLYADSPRDRLTDRSCAIDLAIALAFRAGGECGGEPWQVL